MRIFLAGGTGLVGSRLISRLLDRQDEVVLLTRRPDYAQNTWGSSVTVVTGDPTEPGDWMDTAADCDSAVNLAGENIFNKRWNQEFIELLRTSRVKSTENVVAALARKPERDDGQQKVLVNASAIGIYGFRGGEEIDESGAAGDDPLAKITIDWEKAATAGAEKGLRVAIVRIGVVMDKKGGALANLLPPFKMFIGGKIGSGNQYVSWIHHDDLVGIIMLALDNQDGSGPINATAPNPVTNKDFSKAIGRGLGRPSFMPTPSFGLHLLLGQVAEVITKGQRVLPKKALELGYSFKFPEIDAALNDVLKPEPEKVAAESAK